MERVNHVHVIQIGSGRLIGYVYGMVQRKVPYGECLEFGVTGLDSMLLLLEKLTQTNSHLAASGTGGSNHHQRTGCHDIIVTAESLIGINQGNIVRVTLYDIMDVGDNTQAFEALAESIGTGLTVVVGYYHRPDQKAAALELFPQTQDVHIIGDTQVTANLVLFNVNGTDHYHNLGIIAELLQHTQFTVWLETGEHAAGVMVIEELASELEIKFVSELSDSLLDMFGLYPKILVVVKSVYHNGLQK